MSASTISEIVEQLRALPDDKQREVLRFVRRLKASTPSGVPGKQLLRFAGTIPQSDLQAMREVIEAGCEQVDQYDW